MIDKIMDIVSAFALAGIIETLGTPVEPTEPAEPRRGPHDPR